MGRLATRSRRGLPENGSAINNYVQLRLKMQGSLQHRCSGDWNISALQCWDLWWW